MASEVQEAVEAARNHVARGLGLDADDFRVEGVKAPSGQTGWQVLLGHTREIPERDRGRLRIAEAIGIEPREYVRQWVTLDAELNLISILPYHEQSA